MEQERVSTSDVIHAGRVLFGPSFALDSGWRDQLKSVFRRRALETHPDRAQALGRAAGELAYEFNAVNDAYRVLSECPLPPRSRQAARSRSNAPPPPRPRPPTWPKRRAQVRVATVREAQPRAARQPEPTPTPREAARHAAKAWRTLPQRQLRFAEFLYYTGRVPFSDLVAAIVWQRNQRPPVGRTAVEFGFLSEPDVTEILARRNREAAQDVLFGEYAVRQGFLTPFQLLAVLGRQRSRQRPVGEFFVERGILHQREVEQIRRQILLHNAPYSPYLWQRLWRPPGARSETA